ITMTTWSGIGIPAANTTRSSKGSRQGRFLVGSDRWRPGFARTVRPKVDSQLRQVRSLIAAFLPQFEGCCNETGEWLLLAEWDEEDRVCEQATKRTTSISGRRTRDETPNSESRNRVAGLVQRPLGPRAGRSTVPSRSRTRWGYPLTSAARPSPGQGKLRRP